MGCTSTQQDAQQNTVLVLVQVYLDKYLKDLTFSSSVNRPSCDEAVDKNNNKISFNVYYLWLNEHGIFHIILQYNSHGANSVNYSLLPNTMIEFVDNESNHSEKYANKTWVIHLYLNICRDFKFLKADINVEKKMLEIYL